MEILPSTPSFWIAVSTLRFFSCEEGTAFPAITKAKTVPRGSRRLPALSRKRAHLKENLLAVLCSGSHYDKILSPPSGPSADFDRKSLNCRSACIPITPTAIK